MKCHKCGADLDIANNEYTREFHPTVLEMQKMRRERDEALKSVNELRAHIVSVPVGGTFEFQHGATRLVFYRAAVAHEGECRP